MKVLIHTLFYENYNYGGILQAYALYHYLESQGHECMELNYKRGTAQQEWIKRRINNIMEILKNPKAFKKKYNDIRQVNANKRKYLEVYPKDPLKQIFDDFMVSTFRQSKVYDSESIKNMTEDYDICVVGGDQMWNPLWHDDNFYLKFSNKRNVAYSCSVGKDIISGKDEQRILSGIKSIDCISVREKMLVNWFRDRKIKAEMVSDPIFLFSKKEWEEFSNENTKVSEEYIFAYLLGDGQEIRRQVRMLADNLGIKLVAIPHVKRIYNSYDEDFADYSPINIGPREFVGLIKNAKYVVTDSFHGTAFSIILEKAFISVSRFPKGDKNALNSRILSILDIVGLQDRLIDVSNIENIEDDYMKRIDWSKVNTITERLQEKGKNYLMTNMKR